LKNSEDNLDMINQNEYIKKSEIANDVRFYKNIGMFYGDTNSFDKGSRLKNIGK